MDTSRPRLSILAITFLFTGLIADVIPHPALGPGLLQLGLNVLAPAEAKAEINFERSPNQFSAIEGDRQQDDI
ncbi:MAG: hypothetical protein VKK04_21260 [Synechococcales bacterium]|nr:hypothetical protein [Synechococcales bacterium]